MEQRIGRPNNYKTDEIKSIIDQYVRYTEGKFLISASKVAKFAQEKLYLDNFKYYVIQRNTETKQYLESINEKIKDCNITDKGTPIAVFRTIDVEAMLNLNKLQLKDTLMNLNIVFEDVADKHSKIIQENMKLNSQHITFKKEVENYKTELTAELEKYKSKNKEYIDTISKQKTKIKELEAIVHIIWDREAETILKKQNIFDDDGAEIDETKTIIDPKCNLIKISSTDCINGVRESKIDVQDMHENFLKELEDL